MANVQQETVFEVLNLEDYQFLEDDSVVEVLPFVVMNESVENGQDYD